MSTHDDIAVTHVLVDGFNFHQALSRAFGSRVRPGPNAFNLPRLAELLCIREGLPPPSIIRVFIGKLNAEAVDNDTLGFWRYKIKQMRDQESQGVVLHTRQNVLRPVFRCSYPGCDEVTATCPRGHVQGGMRSVEKGIDVALAVAAIEAGLLEGVRHFLFFTTDSDLTPVVNRLRDHFHTHPGPYSLRSAFPEPRNSPLRGTSPVPFDYALYERSVKG